MTTKDKYRISSIKIREELQNVHYLPQLCQHPESSYLLTVVAYADNVGLSADTVGMFYKMFKLDFTHEISKIDTSVKSDTPIPV